MKNIFNKIEKIFAMRNSEAFKKYLEKKGISIGKGTCFFSPQNICIDIQRPWMISIGEYCKITSGVVILQHDYSRSVLRRKYGEIIGESKKTIIGNNCFIGMNSIILMGSQIGNNVIVGAGSVVSGKFPDNVIIAGNPARIIKNLDEFYISRKEKTLEEARLTYLEYKKIYNTEPSIKEMGSFWQLYLPKDKKKLKEYNIFTKLSGDNEKEIIDYWMNNVNPEFESYEKFKEYAESKKD